MSAMRPGEALLRWPAAAGDTAAGDTAAGGVSHEPGDAPDADGVAVLATRTYQPLELFLFSAAGWHPHRIHYDQPYTTDVEGHEAVVVHGPLQTVHLVDALVGALDVPVDVRTVASRHLALLTVGDVAVMKGRLRDASDDGSSATFEVWMERGDGARTTTATATVERRSSSPVAGPATGRGTGDAR